VIKYPIERVLHSLSKLLAINTTKLLIISVHHKYYQIIINHKKVIILKHGGDQNHSTRWGLGFDSSKQPMKFRERGAFIALSRGSVDV
jgi:hypothetical protein